MRILSFFLSRHRLVQIIKFSTLAAGILAIVLIPKEELPNFTFDRARVSAAYPGASAEDVEKLITQPLEDAIRGVDGVVRVESTSLAGQAQLMVDLDAKAGNLENIVSEIRNAVLDTPLPSDVENEPNVRLFKTTQKAVVDIGLYWEGKRLLDEPSREELQAVTRALENQLLSLPGIYRVDRSGYLAPEFEIQLLPKKLLENRLSFSSILQALRENHLRQPLGALKDRSETQATLNGELDTLEKLHNVPVQGGFEGNNVKLEQLAQIRQKHEESRSLLKVNGHEGILLNVVKNTQVGILEALAEVRKALKNFEQTVLSGSSIRIAVLDDESADLRNRLGILLSNSLIGFFLVFILLFLFLDFRSAFWVGAAIPFSLCATFLFLWACGWTLNNMTLAGVIIVLGMLVDDGIIVSENIHRKMVQGEEARHAAVKGAWEMLFPVSAAVLTTAVAFLPLFFLEGRWAKLNMVIPPVIWVALGASLFESFFLLPSHLSTEGRGIWQAFWLQKLEQRLFPLQKDGGRLHWFEPWEERYGRWLEKVLLKRRKIYFLFAVMIAGALVLFQVRLKYVLFPDEETREISVSAETPPGTLRYETAKIAEKLEDVFLKHLGEEVVGFRTEVARSRRGGEVGENTFRTIVEIVPKEKRLLSADALIGVWKKEAQNIPELTKVRFAKSRWGQESGSPIEIVVLSNNDSARLRAAQAVVGAMEKNPAFSNAEIEKDLLLPAYRFSLKREMLKRLEVSPTAAATALRGVLQGVLAYEIAGEEEEIRVRLSVAENVRDDLEKILDLPVENRRGYLVRLKDLVEVEKTTQPLSITRWMGRRVTKIFSDLNRKEKWTPEQAAEWLEKEVFPKVLQENPSVSLEFSGEIKETRESKGQMIFAVLGVLVLIYVILVILYDSFSLPVLILTALPFGAAILVFVLVFHGWREFGFFAVVGFIGALGVMVNDSIVMVFEVQKAVKKKREIHVLAAAAKTRLRPVLLTTSTTVAGLFPTAYGWMGYDATLSSMMLVMAWGLVGATAVTLVLIPCLCASVFLPSALSRGWGKKAGIFLLFLGLGVGAPKALSAEERTLSFSEFLTTASRKEERFQQILLQALKARHERVLRTPAADFVVDVLAGQTVPALKISQGAETASGGLSFLFPKTGTELRAEGFKNKSGEETWSFSWAQDIAKNAFGRAARLESALASVQEELALYQVVEAYEDYLATLSAVYLDWYLAFANRQTARAAVEGGEKLLENLKERRKLGVALPVDVEKTRLQVLERKDRMIRLDSEYEQKTNDIRRALHLEEKAKIVPQDPTGEAFFGRRDVPEALSPESRTARLFAVKEKAARLALERAAVDLLPSLQARLVYGTNLDFSSPDDTREWGASFFLSFPLSRSNEKAQRRLKQTEHEETVLETQDVLSRLKATLLNLALEQKALEERLRIAAERISSAEKILKEETRNYTLGRTDLNDLLRFSNSLEDQRFNRAALSVDLMKILLERLRLLDELIKAEDIFNH